MVKLLIVVQILVVNRSKRIRVPINYLRHTESIQQKRGQS